MRYGSSIVLIGLLVIGCSKEREQLLEELASPKPVIRAGAVQALAAASDEEAFLLLSRSLEDSSAVVRIAVVQALPKVKDHPVHNLLIRASRDADPEVREAAAQVLAQMGGETSRRALMDMFVSGENQLLVRRAVLRGLEQLGLSGDALATELAQSEVRRIREQLAEAQGIRRAQLVRRAGNSVHPDGLAVVLEALQEADPDVVLTALSVLDGRGAAPALRQLQLLAGEVSEEVRARALRAAARFGEEGRVVLRGALRDGDAGIRRLALHLLSQGSSPPAAEEVCLLLADSDAQTGELAARVAGERNLDCDAGLLDSMLQQRGQPAWWQAVERLVALRSEKARARLAAALSGANGAERPWLVAALLRAGEGRADLAREVRADAARRVERAVVLAESWVGGKLPPVVRPSEEVRDRSSLNQEQLDRLYRKYGLEAPSENAPRSVSDILKAFPEHSGARPLQRLCEPLLPEEAGLLAAELDALLRVDTEVAVRLAEALLRALDPRSVGWLAALLNQRKAKLPANAYVFERLMQAFSDMDLETAQEVAESVGRTEDGAALQAMLRVLPSVPWEKREWLIQALGRMKRAEAVAGLIPLLLGNSAATVAEALADIGDPAAVKPLKAAIAHAAPGQEMHILMALARLGDRELLPQVLTRLEDPDPDVRLAALEILGRMSGTEERKAIELARLDLDRRVRSRAEQLLKTPTEGEESDERSRPQPEGSGGPDAAQGPAREGAGTLPEGSGQPAGR
ncbi:MAG: HEAT repeat domain-containing protein [Myxococcales bacterium]|nr:HEAT repeat domain-containing protein [Myxococcales bacterium]